MDMSDPAKIIPYISIPCGLALLELVLLCYDIAAAALGLHVVPVMRGDCVMCSFAREKEESSESDFTKALESWMWCVSV